MQKRGTSQRYFRIHMQIDMYLHIRAENNYSKVENRSKKTNVVDNGKNRLPSCRPLRQTHSPSVSRVCEIVGGPCSWVVIHTCLHYLPPGSNGWMVLQLKHFRNYFCSCFCGGKLDSFCACDSSRMRLSRV